jgi:GNAT superfamily N-acetyltransferase
MFNENMSIARKVKPMSKKQDGVSDLEFCPLTAERWSDLEKLFGPHGACGGCWCMWWKLKRSEFTLLKGEGRKKAFKSIVESGEVPGILAYADSEAIGWCAVAPREAYPVLGRSRVLAPVDDEGVWSVVCFFVDERFRGLGVAERLLRAAVEHVRKYGGRIVEGYPVEPRKKFVPPVLVYTGLPSMFRKVGFVEVVRRSETRPIMRYVIEEK